MEKKYGRDGQATDDNIISVRMRYTCWMNKTKNTHPERALLIAFPRQQWLHKHVPKLPVQSLQIKYNEFQTSEK